MLALCHLMNKHMQKKTKKLGGNGLVTGAGAGGKLSVPTPPTPPKKYEPTTRLGGAKK